MKKLILAGCALLCLSQTLTAQKRIEFGVHAGIGITTFSEEVTYTNNAVATNSEKDKVGITGGAEVIFNIGRKGFGIQSGLDFSQLGINAGKDASTGYTSKINFNYLTLPVLARFTFKRIGLGVFAGPQYSYMLNAKVIADAGSQGKVKVDATPYFNRSDVSFASGVDYYLKNGLGFAIKVQAGITNVLKDVSILDVDGDAKSVSVRNEAILFTVGYRF